MRKSRMCLSGFLAACLLLAPLSGGATEPREVTASWLADLENFARGLLARMVGRSEEPEPDPPALPDFDPDGVTLTSASPSDSPRAEALPDFDPDG